MSDRPQLTPCFIGEGTLTRPADIARALDTVEGFRYVQTVEGRVLAEGQATLVKLMADSQSATLLVNGCLFVNVMSFRHLTFSTDEDKTCRMELAGDGMSLAIFPLDEPRTESSPAVRLLAKATYEAGSYVMIDDEEEDPLG